MIRSRMASIASAFLCSLFMLLGAPGERADAGDFVVKQCLGSGQQGFFGEFQIFSPDRVDVVTGCSSSGANKIGVYQDRSGSGVPFGSGGQFLWIPPVSVRIYGTTITAKLNNVNSFDATLLGADSGGTMELDGGFAHDGQTRTSTWTDRSDPQTLVVARLSCRRNDGCSNQPGGPKAFFEVSDMEFRSTDRSAPTLTPSGGLWTLGSSGSWHRGNTGFQVAAQDAGSGIASSYLLINNLKLDLPAITCPGDKDGFATGFSPCPASVTRSGTANTAVAPFQEGWNLVQFCTQDYATTVADANRTCTSSRFVSIDNVAPGAPLQLRTIGGEGWRSENSFKVDWQNPVGQRSPINQADFRVVRTEDGSLVKSGTVPVGAQPELGPVSVPAAGEYRLEVTLRDEAGNIGAPGSTILRFDDGRPGDVSPEAASGWISADELPLRQPVEEAEPGGPSGVGGYAIEVSRGAPVSPCPSGSCAPGDLTLDDGPGSRTAIIQNLAEGSHWVSAVAASGAKLASENAGSTLLRVDKTVPEVELSGVPRGWVREPVTVTATALDSASGMQARPGIDDGKPVTVIRAGDDAPYVSPGGNASFTVAGEGVTSVAFWARDLAGNTNDGALLPGGDFHPRPGEATVRIDRRKPTVRIDARPDPADPELVEATVRDGDSGIDSGSFSIRGQASGSETIDLETTLDGENLRARIPSDSLPPGRYRILAQATDRAGNVGRSGDAGDGALVSLPLKEASDVSFHFTGKNSSSRSVNLRHGKTVEVSGRLSAAGGKILSGSRVLLEQNYAIGSRKRVSKNETRTDGNGNFTFRLKPGPSRSIRVRYEGSRSAQPVRSRELKVVVADRVAFRVKPRVMRNGGKALMVGSVKGRGALRPARGKLVAIQYFDPARGRWRPVEVLRATRSGRFKYQYRFRTISFAQRILFRAVSLPESGWPFKPSTSRRQSVIVYPKG